MTAWLLIGATFAVLYALWRFLNWIADIFDWAFHVAAADTSGEDAEATEGTVI